MTTIETEWQIIPEYFKIDFNCANDDIQWGTKTLKIFDHIEFLQIILTHCQYKQKKENMLQNNLFSIKPLIKNILSFSMIKEHWLNNIIHTPIGLNYKIDEDYYIAPLYISANNIYLGVFVIGSSRGNELFKTIELLSSDDINIKILKYTFITQLRKIDKFQEKIKNMQLLQNKLKRMKLMNPTKKEDANNDNNYQHDNNISINIFNGIIEYTKNLNYFVSSRAKKISWLIIFYNIRNYLPKLNCFFKII